MRLSLATRIFVGYAVVLVTFGTVALFSVSELHRNQVEIRLVSEGYLTLSQTAAAIETFHKNQAHDTERLRDEPNVDTRRAWIRLARLYFPGLMAEKVKAGAATARKVLEFAPESEKPFVEDVAKKFDELDARYVEYEASAESAFLLLESPTPDRAAANDRLDRLQQLENALGASIRLLRGSLEARILERVHIAQERERRTGTAIIALSVLAILVGVLATGIAARSLRPVRTLTEGVSKISRGDYTATLGVSGQDEIAVLAREFDAMARSLREREALLVQKQEELLRAERLAAVGKVSAQVAHEIRNPLSSIGLNVEMLQDQLAAASFAGEAERKEANELLTSVTREVDHLTEITEDYLRLARLPAPTLRAENVVDLVDGVLSFSSQELERAGVKVVRQMNGAVPVMADGGQLKQVLHNLVRNAREAMGGGGTLTVSASSGEQGVQVRVSDTGSGLTEEARKRLFEPFFSTKRGGTGLGLSLSRQIVLAHGGTLEAAPSEGPGTSFVITLPRP
jgi:two-component system NtrC family sensor kinase